MNLNPETDILSENGIAGLLNQILAKYKECNDRNFLEVARYHLKVYEKYLKMLDVKGAAAFPNRLEYQKFEIAKLFIDKIKFLEFSLDPLFAGCEEYKDKRLPPLDAFNLPPEIKEDKKMKFCRNIEKGDILHLRVVEASEKDTKLLVINKYNESERVIDYSIYAYFIGTYQLPKPMEVGDFVRAAVFGKLKMEEKAFSKLLVTLKNKFVPEEYKDVQLGLIFKSEIPFYPKDISNCNSFLNYMAFDKNSDYLQDNEACMTSLGIDRYKTYSFQQSTDGKKLDKPKEIDNRTKELKMMEKSMDLIKEAEKQILRDADNEVVLQILEEALKIYPQNDAAYAVRGQLFKRIFLAENDPAFILKALQDCERALDLNPYNLIATRVYLTILLLSAEVYKDEGDKMKAEETMAVLIRCKEIIDVTEMLAGKIEEDKGKESSTAESQSGVVPMDM